MAQLLSAVTPGTLVKLNENGIPVEFYVAKQGYESALNGDGRVLLVRKDVHSNGQWNAPNVNTYANSTIDNWFNTTYKSLLDSWVQMAIGTTKFYYTPGNGNNTVTTLERAVFALSMTESGLSAGYFNVEGSKLPVYNFLIGKPFWTRTPNTKYTSQAQAVNQSGGINTPYANSTNNYRPSFTAPNNLVVLPDGTLYLDSTITIPAIIMQGNTAPVSWTAIEGADSYTLQRKADSGEWEQVYSGPLTTYTDTAGEWRTVQYQVQPVFDGVPGAWSQSDVVEVVPKSAVAISGQDEGLGTITSDIPYSVATDTGNQISLTRTVNGVLVASLTVDGGFAYSIPVMDLPTGTGTIVITATVQTSSGPVTVTRTWTYTKAAQTFPSSGGLAQLAQGGQNIFPLTLAEAVKTIGGPWGGNLSTALDKLAKAAVFNRESAPKYTEVKVDLSQITTQDAKDGKIIMLPYKGRMVSHIVVHVGNPDPSMYDASCNGVWLLRKDIVENGPWNSTAANTLYGSTIMTAMQKYVADYDSSVQAAIKTVKIPYCIGNGNWTVRSGSNGLECKVFPLSEYEVGGYDSNSPIDGVKLDYFLAGGNEPSANAKRIFKYEGSPSDFLLRNIYKITTYFCAVCGEDGVLGQWDCRNSAGYLPCFILPTTFQATYLVGSDGTVHSEQEYTIAGDFADLWGNIIPTAKIETGSYVGTGQYGAGNPNTLTFSFEPKVVFIDLDLGYSNLGLYSADGMFTFRSNPVPEDNRFAYFLTNVFRWGTTGSVGIKEFIQGSCYLTTTGKKVSWHFSDNITNPNNINDYAYIQLNGYNLTYNYVALG